MQGGQSVETGLLAALVCDQKNIAGINPGEELRETEGSRSQFGKEKNQKARYHAQGLR
jgi:hypothetical protein